MRNVIFAAPFPLETTMRFARAAARLDNVRLLGLVQEPPRGDDAGLYGDIVHVPDALDARQLIAGALKLRERNGPIHRVLGILEPLQVQLAQVREALGVQGADAVTADLFRDKARMKERVRAAGLRVPHSFRVRTVAEVHAAAEKLGYPLIVKPIAGAGSADTYKVDDRAELDKVLVAMRHVHEASVEEYIDGEEFTFDTVSIGGVPSFVNVAQYLPKPIVARSQEWVSPVIITVRDLEQPKLQPGIELGKNVLKALNMGDGFTHMEWFRKDDGGLAIGEIAARPPGAHIVLANSYAHDIDMYRVWARAVVDDAFDGPFERKYAVGTAFLRGVGRGRVTSVTGVDAANAKVGHLVVKSKLPQRGDPRSDSYEGDGYVMVRHPDTEVVKAALKVIIETIAIHYA